MSATLDIRFLDAHTLTDPTTLERLTRVFLTAGFSIDEFRIGNQAVPWRTDLESMQGLLATAYQAKDFSFRAWHDVWRLEIRQYLAWGASNMGKEDRAWIVTSTDNTPYFWRPEDDPFRYSQYYLDIGKQLYEVLKPTFGWIDFNYGLYTTHEDIEALELPAIYWANFFGMAYVEKIGRERILAAPAWEIEELPDGGLLYVLASGPGLATDHVAPDKVKTHFGVQGVR